MLRRINLQDMFEGPLMMADCRGELITFDAENRGHPIAKAYAHRGLLPFIGCGFEFDGKNWTIVGEWKPKPHGAAMRGFILGIGDKFSLNDEKPNIVAKLTQTIVSTTAKSLADRVLGEPWSDAFRVRP